MSVRWIEQDEVHLWWYDTTASGENSVQNNNVRRHAFVRRCLAEYAGVDPGRLVLGRGRYGKPEVVWPRVDSRLGFSVSHTRVCSVLAVGCGGGLGIDVEHRSNMRSANGLRRFLEEYGADDRHDVFSSVGDCGRCDDELLRKWVIEEAWRKAIGCGWELIGDRFERHVDELGSHWRSQSVESRDEALFCEMIIESRGAKKSLAVVQREWNFQEVHEQSTSTTTRMVA